MPTRVPRSTIPGCASWPRSSRPGPSSRRPVGPLGRRFSAGSRCSLRPGRCFLTAWEPTSRNRGCPAILTTGPGWASQEPEEKEAAAAQAFRKLSLGLEGSEARSPAAPDLDDPDSQRPGAGLDQRSRRRAEEHPWRRPATPSHAADDAGRAAAVTPPPPPTAVERGKNIHGDEQ